MAVGDIEGDGDIDIAVVCNFNGDYVVTNNGDGTYQYRMVLNVNDLDSESLEQAEIEGLDLSYDEAREIVYGMPYEEWKARYQTVASAEQKAAYEQNKPVDGH